jgi:hypothetical protein
MTNRRITLNATPSKFLIAIERANEAHWTGEYMGQSEAHWMAVAKAEEAKANAKGEAY